MSKGKGTPDIEAVIDRLLASNEFITSGEVASSAGVSRQAAHYHLKAREERNQLVHSGAGRGGRYRRPSERTTTFSLDGLQEDQVWTTERAYLKRLDLEIFDNPLVEPILNYTFTEMLNNAIDHSKGTEATVRWFIENPHRIAFEIEDDGIGVFQNIREERHLQSNFDSIGELSKGKQTTAPERHSGMGIFFSSRMASKFVLSSGQLVWTTDNERRDEAVGWLDKGRNGTLVRVEVSGATTTVMAEVFGAFSHPTTRGFSKTDIRVPLFSSGGDFVSRSEAKRIAAGLDAFELVEIDFSGVSEVGQGFVDELFRVWQHSHPHTELVPINANPAVTAMISRTVPSKP
jgi:anti-sigma regulatory factor (Ser/Thr protein kinase)